MKFELDRVDCKLLNALQDNCQQSIAELSMLANISAPTCQRRLQKLRASGIIARECAILNFAKCSKPVAIFVDIALERHDHATHFAFEENVRRTPAVMQCYNTSGQTDYILLMNVADIAEYHRLATELFASDPSVRTFRSAITIKYVKFDTKIELEPD